MDFFLRVILIGNKKSALLYSTVDEIQLEYGTVTLEWQPSPPKTMAYLKSSHRGRPRRKKTPVSSTLVVVILLIFIFLQFLTLLPSNADMISWPPEQSRRAAREERLIFVHVGKTAGETIQWRLKISCNLRKSKMLKAQCSKHFQDEKNESFLSRSTIGHLHCDRLRPRDSMSNATGFLFSLRNPIHRIISWYQYMHPENCFADRPSAACNLKKDNNLWGVMFYRKCFADVNDFVRAMGDRIVVKDGVNCTSVALETARGEGPAGKYRCKRLPTVFKMRRASGFL